MITQLDPLSIRRPLPLADVPARVGLSVAEVRALLRPEEAEAPLRPYRLRQLSAIVSYRQRLKARRAR